MHSNDRAKALDDKGWELQREGNNATDPTTRIAKYELAKLRYKEAEELSSEWKSYYKNKQVEMLNYQAGVLKTEGDNATNPATKIVKYELARLQYKESYNLTGHTAYTDNQARMLEQQGRVLVATDPAGAIAKYNEASYIANDPYTVSSIKYNKVAALNAQGEALETEGDNATNPTTKIAKYEAARLKFAEAGNLTGNTTYTNNQARMLDKQGQALVATDSAGAIAKYNEALCKANDWHTIASIKNNKASALNAQGLALETEGNNATNPTTKIAKYEAARLRCKEAEELTLDASNKTLYQEQQAVMLDKQGQALVATDPAGAIAKYNEALYKTNKQDTYIFKL